MLEVHIRISSMDIECARSRLINFLKSPVSSEQDEFSRSKSPAKNLHDAASYSDLETVKELIESGANIDEIFPGGQRCLPLR